MQTRKHFEHELAAVQDDLTSLGQMVAGALRHALAALRRGDRSWAQQVIAQDAAINEATQRLEFHAIQLIATQQPVATDLRRLIATIEMSTELERIADHAKGIARIVNRSADALPSELPPDLLALGEQASTMLDAALSAFSAQDVTAALALGGADKVADEIYARVEAAVISQLQHEAGAGQVLAGLLLVAHYLERVADRATNLAEQVIYVASGETMNLNP
jgi:phosphate transport system protein